MTRLAIAALAALALAACAQNTHPEPDSAVMEAAADGSHWVTPAGTRVYQIYSDGALCFVVESAWAKQSSTSPAISCLPVAGAP